VENALFLDEVGDIPLELQPTLLRALQEQQFERLGSTRTQVQSFQARRHSAPVDLVRRHTEIIAERKRIARFKA